jgi:hypothetical protein
MALRIGAGAERILKEYDTKTSRRAYRE